MTKHRVLVLHSDVAPDAPPDELDTLWQADEITAALQGRGHVVSRSPWIKDEGTLGGLIAEHAPEVVFNLVEGIDGSGLLAVEVPRVLDKFGVRYTGAGYIELVNAGNKPVAKGLLRDAGLPTPDWAVPPDWKDLHNGTRMIVKSALEDCSLGLDDGAIVSGLDAIRARHAFCTQKFGGQWFAEAYIEGREFNVAVIPDEHGEPHVLPLAEMMFHEWQPDRPRIVGWQAKWDDDSFESTRTQREFGADENEPALAKQIHALAKGAWKSVGLTSYARVDIRVDEQGRPTVLELNPNPCLSPDAGFAAAAERVGMNYADLMERILFAALA
jgi:D-alanine-D-alanine ligase